MSDYELLRQFLADHTAPTYAQYTEWIATQGREPLREISYQAALIKYQSNARLKSSGNPARGKLAARAAPPRR